MKKAEAIELLRELSNFVATPPETDEAINMAIEALQQEPKREKWEHYLKEGLKWKCSGCGSRYTVPWSYCPNCGARMESDEQ